MKCSSAGAETLHGAAGLQFAHQPTDSDRRASSAGYHRESSAGRPSECERRASECGRRPSESAGCGMTEPAANSAEIGT